MKEFESDDSNLIFEGPHLVNSGAVEPVKKNKELFKINDIEMGHQHKTYQTQNTTHTNNNLLSDDLDDENFDDAHD